jgi:hypothetical protein
VRQDRHRDGNRLGRAPGRDDRAAAADPDPVGRAQRDGPAPAGSADPAVEGRRGVREVAAREDRVAAAAAASRAPDQEVGQRGRS